jgi:hypothetical protein
MARLNNKDMKTVMKSVLTWDDTTTTVTAQGGKGYNYSAQSELYLLALTNFYNQDTFYEKGDPRDARFRELIRKVVPTDFEWTVAMNKWLRNGAHMRTVSLVMACEVLKARLDEGSGFNRHVFTSVIQRPDEPGEVIAYWRSRYGRTLPEPLLKALKYAVAELYTEKAYLKWDSQARGLSFADVLRIVHPKPKDTDQEALFKYILDRSFGKDGDDWLLPVIRKNKEWRKLAQKVTTAEEAKRVLDPDFVKAAGLTWEDVLSALGSKVDKVKLWEALIPSMGYMALLRNLRNFDEAGVSDEAAEKVISKLTDPFEVQNSRQLPMRFYSAYRAAPSLRWGYALERALDMSMGNIPELKGRTLILVDTSGSMDEPFSRDGTVKRWDAATLFGVALGRRCDKADVVSFSNSYWGGAGNKAFPLKRGESLLTALKRWQDDGYFIGGGTDTARALRDHFHGHDRVVILTDEQTGSNPVEVSRSISESVPMYSWNLAGYRAGHAPAGERNRHSFGGLTDAAFTQIGMLENSLNACWPWEKLAD